MGSAFHCKPLTPAPRSRSVPHFSHRAAAFPALLELSSPTRSLGFPGRYWARGWSSAAPPAAPRQRLPSSAGEWEQCGAARFCCARRACVPSAELEPSVAKAVTEGERQEARSAPELPFQAAWPSRGTGQGKSLECELAL